MSFFEKWPYTNFEQLNIDWVLDVVKRAEDMIKHLNKTIESVVRPMIDSQQVYIISYYNTLKSILNGQINNMIADNKKLNSSVQKQLYENVLAMNKLDATVREGLRNNTAANQLEITRLRNEVNNLIAKYDSIWSANSINTIAQIQRLIKDFTSDINAQIADNNLNMHILSNFVNNEIDTMRADLRRAVSTLNTDMAQLRVEMSDLNADTIDTLTAMGHEILSEVDKHFEDVDHYYLEVMRLFDSTIKMLSIRIDNKADLSYVEYEIQRLESLIVKVNRDIIVINPKTMKNDSLQKTLFDIYNNNNMLQLTAEEYDSLGLSAERYDWIAENEDLTALKYDELGKYYLVLSRNLLDSAYKYTDDAELRIVSMFTRWNQEIEKLADERWGYITECCNGVKHTLSTQLYMSSPFDGQTRPLKDVLLQLFGELYSDALTADVYDAKMLDADAYDALMLTAYNYDWHGASLIS